MYNQLLFFNNLNNKASCLVSRGNLVNEKVYAFLYLWIYFPSVKELLILAVLFTKAKIKKLKNKSFVNI